MHLSTANNEKVSSLEAEVRKLPQVNCPIEHIFSPGIYARQMTIPAGTVVTGLKHKHPCLTVVTKGRLKLITDDGVKEVEAGYHGICPAGIKRAAFAIEESVLITFHATTETDIEKVEDSLVEDSHMLQSRNPAIAGPSNQKTEAVCLSV